jgi:isopentenyl-diphosphate delta-isomerase
MKSENKTASSKEEKRKDAHIEIALHEEIDLMKDPFPQTALKFQTFPEIDFKDINTLCRLFKHDFNLPLMILGMTGGVDRGYDINTRLAQVATQFNIPMGLGSLKLLIKERHNPSSHAKKSFDMKKLFPSLFLVGNIGLASFNEGIHLDDIKWLIDTLELNAFCFHINAMQECIQPEGQKNFKGLIKYLEKACQEIKIPLILKEVGFGIDPDSFKLIKNIGLSAIDLASKGGTNWSLIEGMRGSLRLGTIFKDWGNSLEESLQNCQSDSSLSLIASGGIRNGLHCAQALSLGATAVGIGLPLMKAAVQDIENQTHTLEQEILFFEESLKISLFCTGSDSLEALKAKHGK